MIDDKIARVKALIKEREEIDAELAVIFGIAPQPRRGRPRKDAAANGGEPATVAITTSEGSSVTVGESRSHIADE